MSKLLLLSAARLDCTFMIAHVTTNPRLDHFGKVACDIVALIEEGKHIVYKSTHPREVSNLLLRVQSLIRR